MIHAPLVISVIKDRCLQYSAKKKDNALLVHLKRASVELVDIVHKALVLD